MTSWLFVSNSPWTSTGYGKQTKLVGQSLVAAGDRVSVLCNYGLAGAKTTFGGMELYPAGWHTYSEDMLAHCITQSDPDWVVPLVDLWPLHSELWEPHRGLLSPWVPIDHYPPPVGVKSFIAKVQPRQLVAMSRFGQAQMEALPMFGPDSGKVRYVPHCYDDGVMSPGDKTAARKLLGLPTDVTVFGMVAMNKGFVKVRKSFPQVFAAFDMYLKKHDPDAVLFLFTHLNYPIAPGLDKIGMNLTRLGYTLGIPDRNIYIADQTSVLWGIPEERMAELYRAFDVLLLPSMGEGFGVPVVESMACGTPVIVSDFTAQPELIAEGGGMKVSGVHDWSEHHAAWQLLPDPVDICAKMWQLVKDPKRWQRYSKAAVAAAQQYRLDGFLDRHWYPAFENVADLDEYDLDGADQDQYGLANINEPRVAGM